jgi:DNA polymerase III epsilon subunit family exonuclease
VAQHPVYIAIDLEMTGTTVGEDAIIEIGAVRFVGERIEGKPFESFVRTPQRIPYRIQRLTGINEAQVRDAPTLDDLRPYLEQFLGDAPLIGHNVATDAEFLRAQRLALRNPLIDTQDLASVLLPGLKNHTLDALAAHLGVSGAVHHRALADAQTTRRVFLKLYALLEALNSETLEELLRLPAADKWAVAPLIRTQLRARIMTESGSMGRTGGDILNLSARYAETLDVSPRVFQLGGLGQVDTTEDASRSSAASQAALNQTPLLVRQGIAQHARQTMLDGGGLLLDLDGDSVDLVSLLAPAARWAADTGGRVVVSASDAASMRTVAREVMPWACAAAGIAPSQLKVAELSERESYLCLRRWFGGAGVSDGAEIATDVTRGLARMAVWLKQTERGSRWEMALPMHELPAWERTRAGVEARDSAAACPYGATGYCFLSLAQQAAGAARIIVTTHAALAAALVGRDDLLPQATRVIALEPYALEEELRNARTLVLNRWVVMTLLSDLSSMTEDGQRAGLLHWAWQTFCPDDPARDQAWAEEVKGALARADEFFEALRLVPTMIDPIQRPLRVDESVRRSSSWRSAYLAWEQLRDALAGVGNLLRAIANEAEALAPRTTSDLSGAMVELLFSARQLDAIREAGAGLMEPDRRLTTWIRVPDPSEGDTRHAATPRGRKSGGPTRGEFDGYDLRGVVPIYGDVIGRLAQKGNGLILAGPGLAAGGDFEFARMTLGLPYDTQAANHARDRSMQTLLCLPTDVPEPNTQHFQERLNQTLIRLAVELEGRVVVLFSSRNALRVGAQGIRHALEKVGILTLAQGIDGSTTNLWRTFNAERRVVLLGGASFWNSGPSQTRRSYCVVIPKLPIPAEGDPVVTARAELWDHPHEQYYVPAAAQRMHVALSRLAWSHDERNAVVLFDRRALVRDYGHAVLASLPHCHERRAPVEEIAGDIREWIGPA